MKKKDQQTKPKSILYDEQITKVEKTLPEENSEVKLRETRDLFTKQELKTYRSNAEKERIQRQKEEGRRERERIKKEKEKQKLEKRILHEKTRLKKAKNKIEQENTTRDDNYSKFKDLPPKNKKKKKASSFQTSTKNSDNQVKQHKNKLKEKQPKIKQPKEKQPKSKQSKVKRSKKKNDKNSNISSKTQLKKNIKENLTFEISIDKNPTNFTELQKSTFIITNNSHITFPDKFLYKIYYVPCKKKQYLLDMGIKNFSKIVKLPISFKFSSIIPPSPSFFYRIELFSKRNLCGNFNSEKIIVTDENSEKLIKFIDVNTSSNILIPNNPIVVWLKYYSAPIPSTKKIDLKIELLNGNLILKEKKYSINITPNLNAKLALKYPISFPIPDFSSDIKFLELNISVKNKEGGNTLWSKKVSINTNPELIGFYIDRISYRSDIKIGEVEYMVGDIRNNTPNSVKGISSFYLYTSESEKIPCFKRKFHIHPNSYEKLSEDITMFENLAGKQMWVICEVKVNTKYGNYFLEGISEQIKPKFSEDPHFTIKARGVVRTKFPSMKDIIPIGIDTRIRTRDKLKNVVCQIYENYENVKNKKIHTFKIKTLDQFSSNFHWKVPNKCGKYIIDARIFVDKVEVLEKNISKSILEYEIFPK